jgi:hypothetical protein
VIKIAEPEDSTQQVFMTPEARLNDTFLIWWGPFLEGALWLCREFVDAEEPDLGITYLAAFKFSIDAMAGNATMLSRAELSDVDRLLEDLRPEEFGAWAVGSYVEATGIPRQSAKRCLDALVAKGLLVEESGSFYRLAAFTADLLRVQNPCFGFCRWLLVGPVFSSPGFRAPQNGRAWGGLIRQYLAAFLAFAKSRRLHTGRYTPVTIQAAIMLLTQRALMNQLALDGLPDDLGRSTQARLVVPLFRGPFLVRNVATLTGMSIAKVRRSLHRMEQVDATMKSIDPESFAVEGRGLRVEELGSHRLFYTIEMEQRLVQLHTLLLSYVKNVHEADARLPRTAAGNTAQKII